MVARESFGASVLLKDDAEPGEPFNAEEQQDIEEELQVEHWHYKASGAVLYLRPVSR